MQVEKVSDFVLDNITSFVLFSLMDIILLHHLLMSKVDISNKVHANLLKYLEL